MIIKKDFLYPAANEMRRLHIYLPDSYNETEERYPVMYFFDGHNLYTNEDATYGKSWGLKDFLDNWQKDMIIVGIECGHGPG
jgi:predicted alpha/beta superfamily hydrolase